MAAILEEEFQKFEDFCRSNKRLKDNVLLLKTKLELLLEKKNYEISLKDKDHELSLKDKDHELSLKIASHEILQMRLESANKELLIASRSLFARHIFEKIENRLLDDLYLNNRIRFPWNTPRSEKWEKILKSGIGTDISRLKEMYGVNNIKTLPGIAQSLASNLNNSVHNTFMPGTTIVRIDKSLLSEKEVELMTILCKIYPLGENAYLICTSGETAD